MEVIQLRPMSAFMSPSRRWHLVPQFEARIAEVFSLGLQAVLHLLDVSFVDVGVALQCDALQHTLRTTL